MDVRTCAYYENGNCVFHDEEMSCEMELGNDDLCPLKED